MLPLVYDELRAAAGRLMRSERAGHTLQRTALVHEAFAKLAKAGAKFENELHFFNAVAQAMRRILADHASGRAAIKRGGGAPLKRIDLDDFTIPAKESADQMDWSALDQALERLAKIAPRRAQIVMLKFFAGLSDAEIARLLGITASPVRQQWITARAWLYQRMKNKDSPVA
jgi:RNA polymerase sigma factor (TIGR02999 family)